MSRRLVYLMTESDCDYYAVLKVFSSAEKATAERDSMRTPSGRVPRDGLPEIEVWEVGGHNVGYLAYDGTFVKDE